MNDEAQPIGISPEYAERPFVGELNDAEKVALENEEACRRPPVKRDWRGNVLDEDGNVVVENGVEDGPYAELLSGNVDDVNDYIDANPDEADAVIAAERAAGNRKGIVGD